MTNKTTSTNETTDTSAHPEHNTSVKLTPTSVEALCQCGCGGPAPIARRTDRRAGCIAGQPKRFISGHNKVTQGSIYDEVPGPLDTPCWICRLVPDNHGYANLKRRGKTYKAHRYVYEQMRGPIPPGRDLHHRCATRACINPWHLEPLTNAENARRGHAAKLTGDMIDTIKARSDMSNRALANLLGVHPSTIQKVRNGKRWALSPQAVLA